MAQIRRVRAVGTGLPGAPFYQNFFFPTGDFEAADARSSVGNFFNETKSLYNIGLRWTVEGDVPVIDTVTGQIVSMDSGSDDVIQGSNTEEILPTMNQLLVQLKTGIFRNGREVRGRIFLPGWSESQSVNGRPNDNVRNGVLDDAVSYLLANENQGGLLVYSRAAGLAFEVTSASVWSEWAVLRSRRT